MKNLMVYISKDKCFNEEYGLLIKVQIDNSLDLGWKPYDILLVTNFDYEYHGVKSIVVGDEHFCACRPRSIKTSIIPFLIDGGLIEKNEWYWNHDIDAFQMNVFDDVMGILKGKDLGLTDYGWRERWCLGSYFFKDTAKDIFEYTKPHIFNNIEDETAMMMLTDNDEEIYTRIVRMNVTYNFGQRNVVSNYEKAIKPIKVVHFHPNRSLILDIFMYGKSNLKMPIMSKRLINIFKLHGIQ
ncbi:MAG: hypothetical protein WC917_01675 [Bacilli bacterium]|jgi:hypothetical protein